MNVTAARTDAAGTIVMTLDADAADALFDYIDSIDVADLHLNPGYHGYTADQANAMASVLSAIRPKLRKATARY